MPLKLKVIAPYLPKVFTIVIALCLCGVTLAQVKFSTIVNEKQLGLSDYVQVEYTIENAKSVEKLSPPPFKSFRIIQGPVQSNGVSYLNGTLSQYKSVSYILQPLVTGKILVPGATAIINGKNLRSDAVVIEVEGAGSGRNKVNPLPGAPPILPSAQDQVEEDYVLRPGETIAEKISKNLMVLGEVNKTTCYEGEPVMATFKLCSRLRSESRVLKRPSLNGFSVYDMVEPEDNTPVVQIINGKAFNVHIIRKSQLFPLQAGTFTIDPVELDNTVRFVKEGGKRSGGNSPMQRLLDEFMNESARREVEEHTFTLASKPLTITVKPLPAVNRPSAFNGAVGKFTIQADIKDHTVTSGDAIVLHVQIKGNGNFPVINPPALRLPEGMEEFDPVIRENIDKTTYPLSGTKTFDYTFSAKDTGLYKVPPVVFSFFNPREARYETLQSDSFVVRVLPSRKKTNLAKFVVPADRSPLVERVIDFRSTVILIGIVTAIVIGGMGLYRWKRKRKVKKEAFTSHQEPLAQQADKITATPAGERIEAARMALQAQRTQEFYREVNQAIWEKLSTVLNIPSAELNKSNALSRLRTTDTRADTLSMIESVLNECEIALYTPVHEIRDMQQTLHKAGEILKELEVSR